MKKLDKLPDINGKKDLAFQMTVAMRDTINLAKKKGYKATYENTFNFFYDFSPELYEGIIAQLPQRNLHEEAKVFIAKAELQSIQENRQITPIDLVQANIDELKELQKHSTKEEQSKILKTKIGNLESLKKSLKPRKLSENRILIRDTSKADRKDFGATFISEDDFYVDYKLTDSKYLRIRLLHPDQPEHITGADLIYEQHDEKENKMRILFLQYKIWDDGVLYFSKGNLDAQISKMKKCLCDNKHCEGPVFEGSEMNFRFPYCAAFIRPTDKLQEQNEKLVSSGIHIPICAIPRLKLFNGDKLDKKYLKSQTITHEIFEHLFNREFIGSKWMSAQEVEDFYKENKILENDESIIFYAREIKDATSN